MFFTLNHIVLLRQDGTLCCSYNLHYADDSRPVGYDGVVAPLPILDGQSSSASENKTKGSDFIKRFNATIRVADSSVGKFHVSDSLENNKTEKGRG